MPRMRKYGEIKTTRIMMATVPHVTSGSGLRKFQADGFLFDRVYMYELYTFLKRRLDYFPVQLLPVISVLEIHYMHLMWKQI